MSKLYTKYLSLKENNKDKYYLFECGIFYLFIGSDAEKLGDLLKLKITPLNDSVKKCGFPVKSIDKYKILFLKHNLDVEIIAKEEKPYTHDFCLNIIKSLKEVDLNYISPMESMKFLQDLKDKL